MKGKVEFKYESLDGLRAYSAIGIVLMHVLSNFPVKVSENLLTTFVIPWFTNLVFLFFMISSFSLCCGYYNRFKEGDVRPDVFYKKRYQRVFPFFAILVFLDLLVSPSLKSFFEGSVELTMMFSLLPNPKVSVIGVSWFLGVIFLFYIMFPFFVFLINTKKRAWLSLLISIFVCVVVGVNLKGLMPFDIEPIRRNNILYCMPYFILGGIIFLYKDFLRYSKRKGLMFLILALLSLTIYFCLMINGGVAPFVDLFVFGFVLVWAISSKTRLLNNKVVRYISGISMEIYLSHMLIFRVLEKFHFEKYIQNADLLYVLISILTILGAVVFSHVVKYKILEKLSHINNHGK